MTSSTWHALGNTYVVVEPTDGVLDEADASALAQGTDGVLEVLGRPRAPSRSRSGTPMDPVRSCRATGLESQRRG